MAMKILIVRPSPNKVDLNTYNLQEIGLAKALVRKGHRCDVMYYCGREKDHIETVKFEDKYFINILWLHGLGIFREGFYPSLKKYIDNYDVIQVGGYVGITSCWLNRHVGNKVVNYQGPYYCDENVGDIRKAKIWDHVLLPLCHKKRMIVATKSVLATNYVKSKGIDNVTTIGVGLDLDNIMCSQKDVHEHEFIKELKKRKGVGRYLLYIGVFEKRRNILFLLHVFKKVSEKMPDCQLVLIGRGDEVYMKSCFDLMDELNIRDKVIYKECLEQKYVKSVYEISDAFLLPTRYEIFGMVLLEAMYFGLPVFTTYNGGSSTLMTEDNGVIIEQLDKEKWADIIYEVLSDTNKLKRISKNAHTTVAEKYTWDFLADKFLDLYEKRLNKL